MRPDLRLIARAREALGLDEAPRAGSRASRHPHAEGIEEERAGRDRDRLRNVRVPGSRDVLGEPPDGIPIAHERRKCMAGPPYPIRRNSASCDGSLQRRRDFFEPLETVCLGQRP